MLGPLAVRAEELRYRIAGMSVANKVADNSVDLRLELMGLCEVVGELAEKVHKLDQSLKSVGNDISS